MLKAIRDGLVRWAKRIGHWLVRRLAKWAGTKLVAWLNMKADDWEMRSRRPWLRAKFRAAAKWLRSKLPQIVKVATHEYDALADELERKGVPEAVA